MTYSHPAADLIPAPALAGIDEALSVHSDVYKSHVGIRPRLDVVWAEVAKDPADFEAWLWAEVDRMDRQAREAEARKAAERVAFRAKVAALGLDPERYMHLA